MTRSRTVLLSTVSVVAIGVTGVLVSSLRGHTPGPRLELAASHWVTIPDSFPVSGGDLAASGTAALWSSSQPMVFVIRGDIPTPIGRTFLRRPVGVAFTAADTIVEVLDGATQTVHGFGLSGAHKYARVFPALGWIEGATASNGTWYVVTNRVSGNGASVSGARRVFRIVSDTQAILVDSMDRSGLGSGSANSLNVIARHSTGIAVGDLRRPFETRVLGGDSAVTHAPLKHRVVLKQLPADSAGLDSWTSSPLVELDSGYIQILSDLGSDRRVLTRYDRQLTPVHVNVLNAPVGVVAAVVSTRTLLIYRRSQGAAIGWYRWRWVE
jgi:hypothetical protein